MIKRIYNKFFRKQTQVPFGFYIEHLSIWAVERIRETHQEGNDKNSMAIAEEFYEMLDPEYENYEILFALKVK